jgi:hypothetical protein
MKRFSAEQRRLIADYFSQIGVTWFAAGVISIFIGGVKTTIEILSSLSWGVGFSVLFLLMGTFIIKGIR